MQKSSQVSQSLYFSGEGEIGVKEEEMYQGDLLAALWQICPTIFRKKKVIIIIILLQSTLGDIIYASNPNGKTIQTSM